MKETSSKRTIDKIERVGNSMKGIRNERQMTLAIEEMMRKA
jgi:hypothetical protein